MITSPADGVTVNYGGTLNFQATVTGNPAPAVTWDFAGSAANFNGEDPGVVTFNEPGTYTITATASNGTTAIDTVTITVNRPPVDFVFVLDASGSMRDSNKFDRMAMATQMFYDIFRHFSQDSITDRWSAVYFQWRSTGNTTTPEPINLTNIDTGGDSIYATIIGHKPPQVSGYMTPIGEGLIKAKDLLAIGSNTKKVFLLLSDGMENAGTAIETVPVPTAAPPALANNITIYSIGLGQGTEIEADKIRDKAIDSGGDYRAADDPANPWALFNFYAEILSDTMVKVEQATVNEYAVDADPHAQAYIASGTSKAIFIVTTLDSSAPLNFDLLHPDGTTVITPSTIGSAALGLDVYYSAPVAGEAYAFYVIEDIANSGPGSLDMRTAASNIWSFTNYRNTTPGDALGKQTHAIVLEDLELRIDFRFDSAKHYTGDTIKLQAELKDGSRPIKDAKVTVRIDTPQESFGTTLTNGVTKYGAVNLVPMDQKVIDRPALVPIDYTTNPYPSRVKIVLLSNDVSANPNALISTGNKDKTTAAVNVVSYDDLTLADYLGSWKLPLKLVGRGDTQTLVRQIRAVAQFRDQSPRDLLVQQILDKQGKESMKHTVKEYLLYDDGTHGDVTAGDGIYSLDFNATQYEGNYNFNFKARGRTPGSIPFMRSQTISEYVRCGVNPDTLAGNTVDLPAGKGLIRQQFTIKPRDKFGNYHGPLSDNIKIMAAGQDKPLVLYDNLDGSYTAVIEYDKGGKRPRITAVINDKSYPVTVRTVLPFQIQIKAGCYYEYVSQALVAPAYELGLRMKFIEPLYLSVELAYIADLDNTMPPGTVIKAVANADWQFAPLANIFHPYLTMGGGVYGNDGFATGSFKAAVNVGAGLQINILDNLDVYLDFRTLVLDPGTSAAETVFQGTGGVGFYLPF